MHQKCIKLKGELLAKFKCAQCQLSMLNPLKQPLLTVVRPFAVFGLRGTQKDKVTLLKYAKKDFSLDSELAA